MDVNFPRAEQILDFQHGATHLATFAKQFRPDTSEKLLSAWCHTLKQAGGAVMIRVLERLDRKKMTEEVRLGHDGLLNYLRKNVDRMDYPTYAAQRLADRQRGGGVGVQDGGEPASVFGRDALGRGRLRRGGALARRCIAATPISGTPSGATPGPRERKNYLQMSRLPATGHGAGHGGWAFL